MNGKDVGVRPRSVCASVLFHLLTPVERKTTRLSGQKGGTLTVVRLTSLSQETKNATPLNREAPKHDSSSNRRLLF